MRDLVIKGNDHAPDITFKPAEGKFVVSGESRPENARQFYAPVAEWIEDFTHFTALHKGPEQKEYRFNFRLEYMNSISTKLIFDILKRLEQIHTGKVVVDWHYQQDDIDMQENGEEYSRMVNLKFEFHPIEEEE